MRIPGTAGPEHCSMNFKRLIAVEFLVLVLSSAVAAAGQPDAAPAIPWPPTGERVSWQDPAASPAHLLHLHLLAFNDFHGNLETPAAPDAGRPAGGAAVLAAYLEAAQERDPAHTLIIHAGDQLGASPPITRLLQNEPAIQFLNLLADPRRCPRGQATHFYKVTDPRPDSCNVIGTPGNHEFDAGPTELLRLLQGGNAANGPFLERPWRGSRVPYVCANVIDRRTGHTLLPPYAVVDVGGTRVGVIGAVLQGVPSIIPAWAARNLQFTDEAAAINHAARELTRHGVRVIVVTIHQGVVPVTANGRREWRGPLRDIVARLDPQIDVVISGHTHNYTNALFPDRAGRPVLVTQAYSYGMAYADIDLGVDPGSGRVVSKSARVLAAWADAGPALAPDARVAALVQAARDTVGPRVAVVVARAAEPITRTMNAAGESALGNLVADAQRESVHADIAFMNPGGLRADLRAGPVTRGDIMTIHPFGNRVLALRMTGAQVLAVLEEQWPRDPAGMPRVLKTSGLSYVWDPARPVGSRVLAACDARLRPILPTASYRVAVSDFLVGGGDDFKGFRTPVVEQVGPLDTAALEGWFAARTRGNTPPVIDPRIEGRIGVPGLPSLCPAAAVAGG